VLVIDPVHLTGTVRAYIGLGANIGEPLAQIRKALTAIGLLPSTRLVAASSVYRSAAVGYVDQPDYFNSVAAVDTTLTGHALLLALLDIERDGGRTRRRGLEKIAARPGASLLVPKRCHAVALRVT
jgi:2-amino-4-hydroxy-6-hydroxymethyldihydropteridine diphosphokinase